MRLYATTERVGRISGKGGGGGGGIKLCLALVWLKHYHSLSRKVLSPD